VRLLRSALPTAQYWQNLTYDVVEDGMTKRAELDALFVLDRAVILVEAKSGTFSPPAKRGRKDRLQRDLEKLLSEAHRQGERARRYIDENDAPEFVAPSGERIRLDKRRMDFVLPIAVTLESLSEFTATIHDAARRGLFREGPLPWAVSLFDLRVIVELLEFPVELVHYILRRRSVHEDARLEAQDELDWFGSYLKSGLRLGEHAEDVSKVMLTSRTDSIEQYYYHQEGARRRPAPKPTLDLPQSVRAILTEMERRHLPDYLPGALMLLDITHKDRRALADGIKDIVRAVRRRPGVHIYDVVRKECRAEGMTIAVTNLGLEAFERWLDAHCGEKLAKEDAEYWIGLGMLSETGAALRVQRAKIRQVDFPGGCRG
jgi:hypothetical protein